MVAPGDIEETPGDSPGILGSLGDIIDEPYYTYALLLTAPANCFTVHHSTLAQLTRLHCQQPW